MARSTVLRSLHDLGLGAWFGGTLAGAVALNHATSRAGDDTAEVATAGWDRWTRVNAGAIGAHLVGSAGLLAVNSGRVATQPGVGTMSVVKTAVTLAALGATGYARLLGRRLSAHDDARSATEPDAATPDDVAGAQQQLAALQWVVPALTGVLVVVSAFAGEQQRASETVPGIVDRLTPGTRKRGLLQR